MPFYLKYLLVAGIDTFLSVKWLWVMGQSKGACACGLPRPQKPNYTSEPKELQLVGLLVFLLQISDASSEKTVLSLLV